MDQPINASYLNLQEARASAVLLGASAWDVAPTELLCPTFRFVTFFMSYTRGGAAGAFDFALEVSPYVDDLAGVQDWFQSAQFAAGAMEAGTNTTSGIQRELVTYTATGAAIEDFAYGPLELEGTIERLRMGCRESGNAGAPGTVHIMAQFSGG